MRAACCWFRGHALSIRWNEQCARGLMCSRCGHKTTHTNDHVWEAVDRYETEEMVMCSVTSGYTPYERVIATKQVLRCKHCGTVKIT